VYEYFKISKQESHNAQKVLFEAGCRWSDSGTSVIDMKNSTCIKVDGKTMYLASTYTDKNYVTLLNKYGKFKKGDIIELTVSDCMSAKVGATATFGEYVDFVGGEARVKWIKSNKLCESQQDGGYCIIHFKLHEHQPINKGEKMSTSITKTIADVYEKTQDAILVQENLGNQISDNFVSKLHVEANKDKILAEAKKVKKEKEEAEAKQIYCNHDE